MTAFSLPDAWKAPLQGALASQETLALQSFLDAEMAAGKTIYPPHDAWFHALELTPLDEVRVVILGQDPYHEPGQAHGLAFSVQDGTRIPPSLRNIYKELATDIDCPVPTHVDLTSWAHQGVLLLNTTLTVRSGEAASHQGHGWETFTDRVIRELDDKTEPIVFILWGASSRKKVSLINSQRHLIIESAHPSPLSARHGFFGSRPFSRANIALIENGREPINWCL